MPFNFTKLPLLLMPCSICTHGSTWNSAIAIGGRMAAVLEATERAVTSLFQQGRIPAVPGHQRVRLSAPLSLRAIAHAGKGSDMRSWADVIQYEVQGLPLRDRIWIANFGGPYRNDWRILRARGGVQSDWSGHYESAKEALAVLQKEFE